MTSLKLGLYRTHGMRFPRLQRFSLGRAKRDRSESRIRIPAFVLRLLLNPQGRVRLDAPAAYDPVSRQDMKTHDLSIPTNLHPGSPPLPE
jgi:hypothetical protein